jgi:lysozyme
LGWPLMAREVSRLGIRFVAGWEGFRSCPYQDSVGVWTIGYGTTSADRPVGSDAPCISERTARKYLRENLNKKYVPAVPRRDELKRRELDALASFAYNLGPGAVSDTSFSTLARRLKSSEGDTYEGRKRIYDQEMPRWVKAGGITLEGLVKRRRAEVALATKGKYLGRP